LPASVWPPPNLLGWVALEAVPDDPHQAGRSGSAAQALTCVPLWE